MTKFDRVLDYLLTHEAARLAVELVVVSVLAGVVIVCEMLAGIALR